MDENLVNVLIAETTVSIDSNTVLENNYMGMGVQWEPCDAGVTISNADWQRIFHRLDFMRPQIVRLMLNADWYCAGFDERNEPIYTWNSPLMLDLYRELDYLQSRDITVIIGEWNSPATTALAAYNIRETDLRWTRLIVDFLDQIHNVKGYSVVKYYNLINEPNGAWSHNPGWETWVTAVSNLHTALSRRPDLSGIQLVGPDTTDADEWVNATVDQLQEKVGLYDLHRYATLASIQDGLFETQMAALKNYIVTHDPLGAAKRFLLGEAGIVEGKIEEQDTQPHRYDFIYGVWMADYAIQSIRAGQAGAIAWSLDDAMHLHPNGYGALKLKGWGFWNSMGGQHGYPASDLDLRPWFYPWSLLTRNFPRGCETLHCAPTGLAGVRVTAARISLPGSDRFNLTVAIVNDADAPCIVKIILPAAPSNLTLNIYHFFDDDRPVDAHGFPRKKATLTDVDLQAGLSVSLPSRGMVLLTSLERQAQLGA